MRLGYARLGYVSFSKIRNVKQVITEFTLSNQTRLASPNIINLNLSTMFGFRFPQCFFLKRKTSSLRLLSQTHLK